MEFKQIKKNFKVVGMKNSGVFADYGSEVPKFAQQFLRRANEIKNSSETSCYAICTNDGKILHDQSRQSRKDLS